MTLTREYMKFRWQKLFANDATPANVTTTFSSPVVGYGKQYTDFFEGLRRPSYATLEKGILLLFQLRRFFR